MKNKGFTFLELMIVIALLAIFTVITLPYGVGFFQSRLLDEEIDAVTNILQRAQSNAISGKDDSDWGVNFFQEEGRYEIFKGSDCNSGQVHQVFQVSSATQMEGIDCVIFERNTGDPQIIAD